MNTTTPTTPKHIIINPGPKTRFMASAPVVLTRHRDMVSSDQFQMSADHALLEYVKTTCEGHDGNPNTAVGAFFRIQGAYELLGCMKTLAETAVPAKSTNATPDNLNHRV